MAAKNKLSIGDTVFFTDRDGKRKSGKVLQKNSKTARVKVARCGEFLISYNLLQKRVGSVAKKAAVKHEMTRRTPAKKAATRRKVTGKRVCAVPVEGGRLKHNPAPRSGARAGRWAYLEDRVNFEIRHTEEIRDDLEALREQREELKELGKEAKAASEPALFRKIAKAIRSTSSRIRRLQGVYAAKLNPHDPTRLGGRYRHMISQEEDWPAEESMAFAATEPDLYEEEETDTWRRGQTRQNPRFVGNPAYFTKKGEHIYEAVKRGYGDDPRAAEIAARTVNKMAQTKPGLKRNPPKPPVPGYPAVYSRPRVPKMRGVPLRRKVANFLHERLGDPAMPEYALSDADQNRFADAFMETVLAQGRLNIDAERLGRSAGKAAVGSAAWSKAEGKAQKMRAYYESQWRGGTN